MSSFSSAAPDSSAVADILRGTRTVAVVGLSPDPDRPSHEVAQYLQQQGYRIVPVNPGQVGRTILGERCVASVGEAAAALRAEGAALDVVDCFRRAEAMPDVARDAIAAGARCLWMQLGIVNEDAARAACDAGLRVVMDRCMKIEHSRLS